MSKKIITYALLTAMVLSIFSFPAVGYAKTGEENGASAAAEVKSNIEFAEDAAIAESKQESEKQAAAEKTEVKKPAAAKAAKKVTVNRPTNVRAKAVSSSAIRISWNKVKGADGYSVWRYSKQRGKYIRIKKNAKGTSYVQGSRQARFVYRYMVKAYKVVDGKRYYSKKSKDVKARTLHNENTRRNLIVRTAKSRVGSAYRSGASGPRAFDCSGLVYWTYKTANVKTKKSFPRTSSASMYSMLKSHKAGSSIKSAEKGDIIIFSRGGRISHTGIYIGNGKMVHASTPRTGVCIANVKTVHNSGTRVKAVIDIVS